MNFWQRMKDSLTRWMYGRYGADQLSRVILYASLFLLFVSFFTGLLLPFYLSIAGYGWMIFRMFSRNLQKRAPACARRACALKTASNTNTLSARSAACACG